MAEGVSGQEEYAPHIRASGISKGGRGRTMVEEILAAERVHRQKESERHGRREGGPEGGTTDSKE